MATATRPHRRPGRPRTRPRGTVNALAGCLGAFNLHKGVRRLRHEIFRPPPKLTIDEWADKYAILPATGSAEPGRWRTERVPWQRGVMQAISDPTVERVAICSAAQMAKTAVLLNVCGYYIDQDPATILFVQASLDDAREFSRDRLRPFLQETPCLRRKVALTGGRHESTETMLWKEWPGGNLALVGANSATGLARRPRRVVLFDEVDKYPLSAGDKGDPVALGIQRTRTFWNRKIVLSTTPGVKGASRIEKEMTHSDQRRFYVPCPHCGFMQSLRWSNVDFDSGQYVCGQRDESGKRTIAGCGALIEERWKPWMLARGAWRAENPDGQYPGFYISALYSPWTTWADLVTKFRMVHKIRELLQQFVNEELGELWDPQDGDSLDTSALAQRRETYRAEVPAGVGVLVAFIDVQRDWLELLVKGYGAGQESWQIAHHRVRGSTKLDDVWARVDPLLTRPYQHESGAPLYISLCGVDSGDGDNVHAVYRFVQHKQRRAPCPCWATKGSSLRGRPIIAGRPARPNKYGVRVFSIGTDTAKDNLFARLKLKRGDDGSIPPGFVHFPHPASADGGFDDEYLAQFGREQVFTMFERGIPYRVYKVVPDGARNEAVDLEVGCLWALHSLGAGVFDHLTDLVAKVHEQGEALRAAGQATTPAPPVSASLAPAVEAIVTATEPAPAPAAPAPPTPSLADIMRPSAPGLGLGGWVNAWRR